jgi:hypothetical protein
MPRAKKSKQVKAAPASSRTVTEKTVTVNADTAVIEINQQHRTFSHVMYVLFLVAVTIATYFTFQSFRVVAMQPNFYPVFAILLLLWSFLFWEFGHRMHTV